MVLAHVGAGGVPTGSPWTWDSHPDVLAVAAILVLGYWFGLRHLAPKLVPPTESAVTPRQLWCFGLAIVAFLAFTAWPLHDLAEGYLLSAHMVQHLGLTLVFPPLLLLGTPSWLLGWIVRPGKMARFLTRPVVGLVAYGALALLSHAPPVANAAIRNGEFHLALHVALVGTALLMWLHVVGSLPDVPAIPSPFRWGYLFIAQLPLTIPTTALAHANWILYQAYIPFPEVWGLSDLEDQRLAGGIMAVLEGLVMISLIGAFLVSLDRRGDRDAEALPPDNDERFVRAGSSPA